MARRVRGLAGGIVGGGRGEPGDLGSGPDSTCKAFVCATGTRFPALPEDLTASF